MGNDGHKNLMEHYQFTVYIDSQKERSVRTVERLKKLCSAYAMDSYSLDVVDIKQNILQFIEHRVLAIPTVDVRTPGKQTQRFVGDLFASKMFASAVGFSRRPIR